MCGRFTLLAKEDEIRKRFAIDYMAESVEVRYNIAPTQRVFVVLFDGEKKRGGYIQWGLVPSWAKDPSFASNLINARVETAHEKPSFRSLLVRRRCLVIADSFYEWQAKEKTDKVVHRIQVKGESLFAFAGLWDKWENGEEMLFTCTMLTKDANEFMRPIHHRMPIILPKEKEDDWLTQPFTQPIEAQRFLTALDDPDLQSYEVSTYVNHPKHDDEACIQPL